MSPDEQMISGVYCVWCMVYGVCVCVLCIVFAFVFVFVFMCIVYCVCACIVYCDSGLSRRREYMDMIRGLYSRVCGYTF